MRDHLAIKIIAYTDGGETSTKALQFAAKLTSKLHAELSVIAVQSDTHAIDTLPPIGEDFPLIERKNLPSGIQALAKALDVLTEEGVFDPSSNINIRELPHGHIFVKVSRIGKRIPFYLYYGYVIEMLNREIERNRCHLLIAAPPRHDRIKRIFLGNFARKLVLDLHTSVMIVRGGGPDDRYLICSDGSTAAKRQFPLVKELLPSIGPPLELICVQTPAGDKDSDQEAASCIEQAEKWLEACGRRVKVHRPEGKNAVNLIGSAAGDHAVIVVGASLRHDAYRRFVGSLPMKVLEQTASTVLVVKQLPVVGDAIFEVCDIKDPED